MRFKEYLKEKIEFNDEMTGSQSGQSDLRLSAKVNGEIAGYIDYTEYKGTYSVKYIHVDREFRKQGIGKELVLQLQKTVGKKEINFGGLTDQGAKLIASVKSKLYVDRKRINKIKALKKEYKKLEQEEKELVRQSEKGTLKNPDRFNYISDRQWEIEEELGNMEIR